MTKRRETIPSWEAFKVLCAACKVVAKAERAALRAERVALKAEREATRNPAAAKKLIDTGILDAYAVKLRAIACEAHAAREAREDSYRQITEATVRSRPA